MARSTRRWRLSVVITLILLFSFWRLSQTTISEPSEIDTPVANKGVSVPNIIKEKPHFPAHNSEKYSLKTFVSLPTGKPVIVPKIQATPKHPSPAAESQRLERLAAVKASFVHSWEGYKKEAWLRDEVIPVDGGFRDTFGGWAATLIDSLDGLWILGLKTEFETATRAVEKIDFGFTKTDQINVFETTIRYLGGLLAAYDVSGHRYPVLLRKAEEVGKLLMGCFDTENRLPIARWNWKDYLKSHDQNAPIKQVVSEVGSLTLEFTRLSQLTGNAKYYDAVQRISNVFEVSQNRTKLPGMWPVMVDTVTPDFTFDNWFTLGGMSDSVYEYLPKQYLLLGGLLSQPREMYQKFIKVAKRELFFKVMNKENKDLLVSGDIRVEDDRGIVFSPKGQHLGCFVGGMVGIGAKIFETPEDLEVAIQLTEGCVWAYDSQVTGIAPEIFNLVACPNEGPCAWEDEKWYRGLKYLNVDALNSTQLKTAAEQMIQNRRLAPGFTRNDDVRYILRPEAIESVFIMYRITGDSAWQDKAWRMFQAIEKMTKTAIAATAILDVTNLDTPYSDSMESFWLGETLKYFYLIFEEPTVISLDEWVFNTEAHPLMRPGVQVH